MIATPSRDAPELRNFLIAASLLAAVVLVLFGEFLFGAGGTVPSDDRGDTSRYLIYARDFAAREILQGNLPLWNPHTFSGTPFVGVFQSSVFYPLNVTYLFLPLDRALSLEFALALFLLGLFQYLWLRNRGLHVAAATFAAITLILSGPCLLRVLAGALTVLGVYTWVPLLLLSIDRLAERGSARWVAAGVVAASMMVVAGHPPTVFMALVAVALYALPALLQSDERWRLLGRLSIVALAPVFITAIQLWPGLQVAAEATRQSGMSFGFATSFSLPPESLLTLFAPNVLGHEVAYFGNTFYWDASAYLGVVSLVLIVHGSLVGRGALHRRALGLLVVLIVLSLGHYTPVYKILFDVVPGFAYVRAPSKFMFFAAIFGAALAGIGLDRLLRAPSRVGRTAVIALVMALGLALVGLWVWSSTRGIGIVSPVPWLYELTDQEELSRSEIALWHELLSAGLLTAAGLTASASALLWIASRRRVALWALLALGTIELGAFARGNIGSIDLNGWRSQPNSSLVEIYERAGEHRILSTGDRPNSALTSRGFNIWGYDPVVLGRYLEFMAHTQRTSPAGLDNVAGKVPQHGHRLLRMLRVKYGISWFGEVIEFPDPMPRFSLVRRYEVFDDPDLVIPAMDRSDFDPRRTVLLEEEPVPAPRRGRGHIDVRDESTDHIVLEVETSAPAILLVTDSYSLGWRAVSLPGSTQGDYEVLPANLVLRAIPLDAGWHLLRLEYSPWAFRAGRWATGGSLALAGAAGLMAWRRRPRRMVGGE